MSVTRCAHCGRPIESVCSCAKAQQEAQCIPTPVPAASERRGPFEVDTRPERIFEIRALAEVRAFGNGSGADMALRDLLALVDKQAAEYGRVSHELTRLQLLERILQTPLDGLIPKIAAAEARLEDRELLLKEAERRCENAIAGREALRVQIERLRAIGTKILAKLDSETASVTQWDADELREALSPQPDRAKADEDVDLHKVIATAFYEGCKRIWPKRRLPYKASLLSVAYADEVAPAIIRTLTARAEAAEARAETARADALEEAAKVVEGKDINRAISDRVDTLTFTLIANRDAVMARDIRALRTAPPPTAKEG